MVDLLPPDRKCPTTARSQLILGPFFRGSFPPIPFRYTSAAGTSEAEVFSPSSEICGRGPFWGKPSGRGTIGRLKACGFFYRVELDLPLSQSVCDRYFRGLITYEDALVRASDANEFKLRIEGIASTSDVSRMEMERVLLNSEIERSRQE